LKRSMPATSLDRRGGALTWHKKLDGIKKASLSMRCTIIIQNRTKTPAIENNIPALNLPHPVNPHHNDVYPIHVHPPVTRLVAEDMCAIASYSVKQLLKNQN